MAEPSRVAILVALRQEAQAIGKLNGVAIHVVGIGAKRMPTLARDVRIIVAGLGGALDPALRAGDLVLDTPIPSLPKNLPWHLGPIHTADRLVSTAAEKASLLRETGALAVDMEQRNVVCHAAHCVAPVIGLRAISDTADMSLDPAVLRFVDDTGRPRPLAITTTLLRRPSLVPHLMALRSNTALALRNLGLGVRALLERFPPDPAVAYAPPDSP